ncbi:MAG: hypothetical protein ACTSW1_05905 [Candidatus Hodarchaeales archaeon]
MTAGFFLTILGIILFVVGIILLYIAQSDEKETRKPFEAFEINVQEQFFPFRLLDKAKVQIEFKGIGKINSVFLTDHFSTMGSSTNEYDYAKHWTPDYIKDNAKSTAMELPAGEYMLVKGHSMNYEGKFTIEIEYTRMKHPQYINFALVLTELGSALFVGGLALLATNPV